jgi:hypothetical protein
MMRITRAFLLVAILVCLGAASAAAKPSGYAIGGEGALYLGSAGGLPMSAMLTFHIPQLPLMFAIGVKDPAAVAATVDYWAAHGTIRGIFSWYAGIGAYLSVDTSSDGTIAAGGRIPIGLQAWPIGQVLEIFLEGAPAVGVTLVPTGFDWHLQAAVGLRVWL